jgi:hypothetical protein
LNSVTFTLLARDVPSKSTDTLEASQELALWSFAFDEGAEIPPHCYPGPITLTVETGALELIVKDTASTDGKVIVFPKDKDPLTVGVDLELGKPIPLGEGDSVFQDNATVCYRDATEGVTANTCVEGVGTPSARSGVQAGRSPLDARSSLGVLQSRMRAAFNPDGGAKGQGSSSNWPVSYCGDRGC